MRKFELVPIDNRKSFYGKCYVIDDGNTATLYSYGYKILTLDKGSKDLTTTKYYNYSQTTKRHQKAFFTYYGVKGI